MMQKQTDSLVLSVDQTAAALNLSRGKAYQALREGVLPSVKVGRRILVPRAALERFLSGDGQQEAA